MNVLSRIFVKNNILELFTPRETKPYYIQVIIPLALRQAYTYLVPEPLVSLIEVGIRVEVPFGKSKLYAGLVHKKNVSLKEGVRALPIHSIIDNNPIVSALQFDFWEWLANYYCCSLGEIMIASLPSGLKLTSQTKLVLLQGEDIDHSQLTDKEYLITEALSIQTEISIEEAQAILGQKTIYPIINSLLEKRILRIKEELVKKYKPKKVQMIRLKEEYQTEEGIEKAFAQLSKNASSQEKILLTLFQIGLDKPVIQSELAKKSGTSSTAISSMVTKGLLEKYDKQISRIPDYAEDILEAHDLTEQQINALSEIETAFSSKEVALLHGVTGSGKTRVYIELIRQCLEKGEQVLYLLPEIALTSQIIFRLQKIFGNDIAVYHSRLNHGERVELWRAAFEGKPILLGARSSLLLPFKNLKLIIIDEEHDPSFKQTDPSPRYNARDAAIFLAGKSKAKVLLGSATPSIESYSNAKAGKYGLINMPKRFGNLDLPKVEVVDLRIEMKKRTMRSHFSSVLLKALEENLDKGKQAILFKNRRGYAPSVQCNVCGWVGECIHCDVALTYHRFTSNIRCHYCGYQTPLPRKCAACGNPELLIKGYGTEKIEDELNTFFPGKSIFRMDLDTARTKNAHRSIISRFENKEIDILVGTQMVTKGLDFDNVGLVGVLSSDQLLQYPDFRSSERAFQLMTQVAGRAGRKNEVGRVIIQSMDPKHPVIKEVIDNDFDHFFNREIQERKQFIYPPYYRLIGIQLKHKKKDVVERAAALYGEWLTSKMKKRVIGPAVPNIERVRTYYLMDILIKLERDKAIIDSAKELVLFYRDEIKRLKGFSQVRFNIDVDPY